MLSLIKELVTKYWWIALGAFVFFMAVSFAIRKTRAIDTEISDAYRKIDKVTAQLKEANDVIKQMHDEHEIALEVANQALRERLAIYEEARERICRAEEAIGSNTNFCDQLIPDDISLLWDTPTAGSSNTDSDSHVPAAN